MATRRRPLGTRRRRAARGRWRSPRSAGPSESPHHDAGWSPVPEVTIGTRPVTRAAAAPRSAPARRGRRAPRRAPARRRPRTAARRSPSAHASTSSHDTGVDTVGSGRARSEYGAIVVLWWAFWLQSTKILPGRSALAITVVTRFGQLLLQHLADGEREVGGAPRGSTPGVFSGTYSCRPFEPDVLHHPRGRRRRARRGRAGRSAQQSAMSVVRPGIEVEHDRPRRVEVGGQRHRRVDLDRRHVGRPHQRRRLVDAAVLDAALAVARARAPRRPTPGGGPGSASRRSPGRRCRWGSAGTSAPGPRGAGRATAAMRA